jgi:cytoskeletal protein CcmA (bactofilin family)
VRVNIKRSILILLTAVSVLAVMAHASKIPETSGEHRKIITIPAGEVIGTDYFAAGEIVEIYGTIKGDAYIAAGEILVDGTVEGDLLAAGGTVKLLGTVSQDARIAGGEVTVSGRIGRNTTLAGGDIDVTNTSTLDGGLVAAGGNVSLDGPVKGYVKVAAGNLTVSNRVGGKLDAAVGEMRLTSHAVISGDLTYWSDRKASIDERALVAGNKTWNRPSEEMRRGMGLGAGLVFKLLSFVSTLIVGLLLIGFFPHFSGKAVSTLSTRPWASLGMGVAVVAGCPFALLIIAITVVGIPLALIFLALYLIGLYLAKIFVISWAGTGILGRWVKGERTYWAFFTGLVLYFFLTLIPVLGGLIGLFVLFFGLGAAVISEWAHYRAARKKEIVT